MTATAAPAAPKGRLGNGQLRRQVAEYLTDHPGPCKTGDIAKALDRSAGAVGNALTTLADRAEAARITGKPLRYEANSAVSRRSRRHHPQGTLTAQVRLCRAAVATPKPAASSAPKAPAPKAAPGPVTRPGGQVYRPRVCSAVGRAKSRQQITSRLGHGGHSRLGVSGPIRPSPAHVAAAVVSCAYLTAAASLAAVA
jgi:hypothetical protein